MRRSSEVRTRVAEAMEELGIADLGERSLAEVSGGQLQRAAIARSVIHHPKVILADEPTGSLDGATAGQVLQALVRLARSQESALVIVTHDVDVASQCDKRFVLREGRLQSEHTHASGSA